MRGVGSYDAGLATGWHHANRAFPCCTVAAPTAACSRCLPGRCSSADWRVARCATSRDQTRQGLSFALVHARKGVIASLGFQGCPARLKNRSHRQRASSQNRALPKLLIFRCALYVRVLGFVSYDAGAHSSHGGSLPPGFWAICLAALSALMRVEGDNRSLVRETHSRNSLSCIFSSRS